MTRAVENRFSALAILTVADQSVTRVRKVQRTRLDPSVQDKWCEDMSENGSCDFWKIKKNSF